MTKKLSGCSKGLRDKAREDREAQHIFGYFSLQVGNPILV
jgi:hypothetical protein